MDQQIVAATRAAATDATDEAVLRVAVRGFLAFVTGEPEFAKIFYVDMPAAGPHATAELVRAGSGPGRSAPPRPWRTRWSRCIWPS